MTTTTNAATVAARIGALSVTGALGVRRVMRHHTMLLETRIKANANLPAGGPPGPRNITGDYVRSWTHRIVDNGRQVSGTVGTNKPQARRLEHGFTGADRLGRVYNQPPYPHVLPAMQATEPQMIAALRDVVRAML